MLRTVVSDKIAFSEAIHLHVMYGILAMKGAFSSVWDSLYLLSQIRSGTYFKILFIGNVLTSEAWKQESLFSLRVRILQCYWCLLILLQL